MKLLSFLVAALCLSGCHRVINCRSEYLFPSYLASTHVGSPDPMATQFCGQQIVVEWNLSPIQTSYLLKLQVRYANRTLNTFFIPLASHQGFHLYRLLNEEFELLGKIISFKAEIFHEEELIASWTHSLWADIINI